MGIQFPGPNFFLSMYQLFQPICRLPSGGSSCVLSVVGLSIFLASALGGIPELALQLFRPSQKTAPEELLRRGLKLFFCTF